MWEIKVQIARENKLCLGGKGKGGRGRWERPGQKTELWHTVESEFYEEVTTVRENNVKRTGEIKGSGCLSKFIWLAKIKMAGT